MLDVAFREDLSRMREGNAATNFAIVRRMALAMLKKVEGAKGGVGTRRLITGWDTTFLKKVLQVEPPPNQHAIALARKQSAPERFATL